MISRAFLGTCAALSLAAACPSTGTAAVQVSQSGWQWGNPTPQGNTIRAIDFVQGRGYAIGDDGTALRTDDGGATWTGLPTGTSLDLGRVQAVTPDVVIVLGGNGCRPDREQCNSQGPGAHLWFAVVVVRPSGTRKAMYSPE